MGRHIPRAQEALGDKKVHARFECVSFALDVSQCDFSLQHMHVFVIR